MMMLSVVVYREKTTIIALQNDGLAARISTTWATG
jgi:hypothetical protein